MRVFAGSILLCSIVIVFTISISAQTTEFTYQGSLQNSSAPASGNFDFEFLLFDSLTGGVQQGATLTRSTVAVSAGTFSVKLDFGSQFPGANRFLEIRVRTAGGGAFTPLTPRQTVGSSPYAVQSLNATNATTATNATQLGGVAAAQYVLTGDSRLSDARSPTAGSPNYVQNGTVVQALSNFNISGNGTAGGTLSSNIVNAATQYNLSGSRMLSNAGTSNLFAGFNAGLSNTSGGSNAFFGHQAGNLNTTGYANAFFGAYSGNVNSQGFNNTFFGPQAGFSNTTGSNNVYFGTSAGNLSTTGGNNVFVGTFAGFDNTTGHHNTALGWYADFGVNNLSNATAVGSFAYVSQNNSMVLGSINGVNGATADTYVGIGTSTPNDKLDVNGIIRVATLGVAGATSLCRNASNQISTCSSSARYKNNISSFSSGLSLIRQLRPVSFNWKDGGMADMGLVAEDVAAVEPLLTTTNAKGEVEGVKYDRVGVVMINAVKEQQAQIEALRLEIDALKAIVCAIKPGEKLCQR